MKSSFTLTVTGHGARHSPVQRSRWHWRSIVRWLFSDPLPEPDPQVWHTCDQAGNIWWSADDPANHRAIHRVPEAEMRRWLEQRHQVNGRSSCIKYWSTARR